LEGSSYGLIEVLSWYLPEGTKENYEMFVRITSIPPDIRTQHIPNRCSEHYCYTNLLGFRQFYLYWYYGIYAQSKNCGGKETAVAK
jgi:hypothetical protein